MKKSTFAKIGTLAAGSLLAGSAFAFQVSFEPAPQVAPKVAIPQVNVAPGKVAMPQVQVAPTAIGGFNGAFQAPEKVVKSAPIGSCQAGLPKQLAAASGRTEIRVNELFAKHILNESSCETGLGDAGVEAQKHLVATADYAEARGILSATDDQGQKIAGQSLQQAFHDDSVEITEEEGTEKIMHVADQCAWFNFPAHASKANIHAGNGSIN